MRQQGNCFFNDDSGGLAHKLADQKTKGSPIMGEAAQLSK